MSLNFLNQIKHVDSKVKIQAEIFGLKLPKLAIVHSKAEEVVGVNTRKAQYPRISWLLKNTSYPLSTFNPQWTKVGRAIFADMPILFFNLMDNKSVVFFFWIYIP